MISDDGKVNEAIKNVTSDTVNSPPKGAMTNAGWNSFFPLISGVISFILTPLLIHYLGVSQYGILLLIWSALFVLCVDWVLGGDPPSKQFFERIRESDKLRELISHIPGRQIR